MAVSQSGSKLRRLQLSLCDHRYAIEGPHGLYGSVAMCVAKRASVLIRNALFGAPNLIREESVGLGFALPGRRSRLVRPRRRIAKATSR